MPLFIWPLPPPSAATAPYEVSSPFWAPCGRYIGDMLYVWIVKPHIGDNHRLYQFQAFLRSEKINHPGLESSILHSCRSAIFDQSVRAFLWIVMTALSIPPSITHNLVTIFWVIHPGCIMYPWDISYMNLPLTIHERNMMAILASKVSREDFLQWRTFG